MCSLSSLPAEDLSPALDPYRTSRCLWPEVDWGRPALPPAALCLLLVMVHCPFIVIAFELTSSQGKHSHLSLHFKAQSGTWRMRGLRRVYWMNKWKNEGKL